MKVAIIDTGCSNIYSLISSLNRLSCNFIVSSKLSVLEKINKFFLPGVGSIETAMKKLLKNNLVNFIRNLKKPLLGICLGMQLLCNKSEENNGINSLQIIQENVKLIKSKKNLRVPHIGWNKVIKISYNPLFFGIPNNSYFYFVHSYFVPICLSSVSTVFYGSFFTSVLQYKNFFGTQFHPERSGILGEKMLKNFLEI